MGSVSVIYGWECVALLLNICRIETVVLKETTSIIKTQKEPNNGRLLTVWLRKQRLYVVENLEGLLSAYSVEKLRLNAVKVSDSLVFENSERIRR